MPEALMAVPARVRPGLAERLRGAGLWPTLRKAFADHVLRWSTSVIVEYRAEWAAPLGRSAVYPEWLSFAIVRSPAELPPLCDWLAWRAADFARMLEAGKVAVFALDEGVAVSCIWLSLSDHHDPASRELYRVQPGEAYHYCWLTDPTSRRRNVTMPLGRFFLANLAQIGINRTFGVVDRVNRASYLLQCHFGYRERGVKVFHIVVFGQRWMFRSRYSGVLGTAFPDDRKMPRA